MAEPALFGVDISGIGRSIENWIALTIRTIEDQLPIAEHKIEVQIYGNQLATKQFLLQQAAQVVFSRIGSFQIIGKFFSLTYELVWDITDRHLILTVTVDCTPPQEMNTWWSGSGIGSKIESWCPVPVDESDLSSFVPGVGGTPAYWSSNEALLGSIPAPFIVPDKSNGMSTASYQAMMVAQALGTVDAPVPAVAPYVSQPIPAPTETTVG